jgi:hypothetical protein
MKRFGAGNPAKTWLLDFMLTAPFPLAEASGISFALDFQTWMVGKCLGELQRRSIQWKPGLPDCYGQSPKFPLEEHEVIWAKRTLLHTLPPVREGQVCLLVCHPL